MWFNTFYVAHIYIVSVYCSKLEEKKPTHNRSKYLRLKDHLSLTIWSDRPKAEIGVETLKLMVFTKLFRRKTTL